MENLNKNDQIKYENGAIQAYFIVENLKELKKLSNDTGFYEGEGGMVNRILNRLDEQGVKFPEGLNKEVVANIDDTIDELKDYAEIGGNLVTKNKFKLADIKSRQELANALSKNSETTEKSINIIDDYINNSNKNRQIMDKHTDALNKSNKTNQSHIEALEGNNRVNRYHSEKLDDHTKALNEHSDALRRNR